LQLHYFSSIHKDIIDKIYAIVNKNVNTESSSKHYWNEDIQNEIHNELTPIHEEILQRIGQEFRYIPSITELYYSSKHNNNSDKQYVNNHMDGPFYACNVYRVLVIINGNKNIDTHFPCYDNTVVNLKKYDILLFDYNNDPHYIDINNKEVDDSQRIILKLHYVKSDNTLCEKNHCEFARESRDIFEINKQTLYFTGIFSRIALLYNTNRAYILFFIFLLILLYCHKYKKGILRYILYTFVIIEFLGIIILLHYSMFRRPICNYTDRKEK